MANETLETNPIPQRLRYFSAFAGIGVTELAFKNVFPDSVCVGYSEIDPYAIAVYREHFPDHVNFGDITKLSIPDLPPFDMFIMGSPCTDLSSFQFTKLEWGGTRSVLFFDALKILRFHKPRYFLMENVASMRKERRDDISKELGVEPVMINSVCFGACHRRRLYWANFPVRKVEPDVSKHPHVEHILLPNVSVDKRLNLTFKGLSLRTHLPESPGIPYNISHANHKYYRPRPDGKFNPVLTTSSLLDIVWDGKNLRYLTMIELERLQTLPDDYTKFGRFKEKDGTETRKEIVKTRRHRLIGNSFHLKTIEYILNCLKTFS
jgi:site-specific DNA-cytosine methylase